MVSFCPPDFLVNVTLNKNKRITNVFAGEYITAHKHGCDYVQQHSMIKVDKKYPVAIVTNNGFPLDQNLYQSVKGLMAANEIVTDDGIIIIFAECHDGIPSHGNFEKFVKNKTPVQILEELDRRTVTESDQWEAQVWAEVFKNRKIYIYSSLPDSVAKSFNLHPLHNYQKEVNNILEQLKFTDVAVLPEGPVAIPYFK
jgi:nickel-dependent lactate racemase